ncbi:MAG: hypothetical protein JSV78_13920 [Phycisphaerales bacterium]|nr:MAG: hypothetical protein JSV78_13920 [Phycisphaerales bacterium]
MARLALDEDTGRCPSQSSKQLCAAILTQRGRRLSLDGFSKWSSAKGVMDRWAKRFRELLDATHGG